MSSPSIYVETFVHADIERVWQVTQDPALHRQWDLRFTEIEYLPKSTPESAQQFLYATRIGFGMRIEGRGESVGTREKNGERTPALRFWSDDRKSLIRWFDADFFDVNAEGVPAHVKPLREERRE